MQVSPSKFVLSSASEQELAAITDQEWATAIASIVDCSLKDTAIVKLYVTCLDRVKGLTEAATDRDYLACVQQYMRSVSLPQGLHPDLFNTSEDNIERVRELLCALQKTQVQDNSPPTPWVETLTNVLFEVLQHVGIIPS